MPRGGPRPGAGRPKGSASKKGSARPTVARKPRVRAPAAAPVAPAESKLPEGFIPSDMVTEHRTPLDYMLAVVNDPTIDAARRDRMAVAAAPYLHPKVAESGKKEDRAAAASAATSGRFGPPAAPKLRLVK